jgi:hypothetical protein
MDPTARALNLVAEILFSVDEAHELVTLNSREPWAAALDKMLTAIRGEADALIQTLNRLDSGGHTTAAYPWTRDPEVTEILAEIGRRLDSARQIRGRESDDALELAEAYAADHALVLFHEVQRLESVVGRITKNTSPRNA